MESLTSGTMAGNGSFRCQQCGYVLTLAAADKLVDCPGCGGRDFVRASLFSTSRFNRRAAPADPETRADWVAATREQLDGARFNERFVRAFSLKGFDRRVGLYRVRRFDEARP